MARVSEEHLSFPKAGVPVWNAFMRENGYEVRGAFGGAKLAGFDLRGAVMNGADFWGTDLRGADLSEGTFNALRLTTRTSRRWKA
jgi:uncharacterized protein YjbI with pentapeptide repeats